MNYKPDIGNSGCAGRDDLVADAAAGVNSAQDISPSIQYKGILTAAAALCENRMEIAEEHLSAHLESYPTDVIALRMLAEVAARRHRYGEAEALLVRCLELMPSYTAARHQHAIVLHLQNKPMDALRAANDLLAMEPRNPAYMNLKAAILARIGELEDSIEIYASVLAEHPAQPKIWLSYGHALKTHGHESGSRVAYRKSIELQPSLGEAYWSLANLKTAPFTISEFHTMRVQLERPDLAADDRLYLHFAMGKALEDKQEYATSFEHFALGNQLRRRQIRYRPDEMTKHVAQIKSLFSEQFFADRKNYGAAAADPIFIVGLPRAGSTLVEQILSSHSQVEGTMELTDIPIIARSLLDPGMSPKPASYSAALANLNAKRCCELGELYLARTRIQRKTAAPLFVDKMPNNFAHIDLIQLALPNSKIIDARRHPMACCFSAFKQHFARGQGFTYSLEDIGRYYRDYIELMAFFDQVLPGRIHRVNYEAMIDDSESEIRRLFDYCGLPFEKACLRFYENERAVRSASSQQVRKPIFRESLNHWRHYEPWLSPLKEALGAVLESYPVAPMF